MKLWIDDERPAPAGWFRAHTLIEALAFFMEYRGLIEEIAFDHDLGGYKGIVIAQLIEHLAYHRKIQRIKWVTQSQNSPGRDGIIAAMEGAERWWRRDGLLD